MTAYAETVSKLHEVAFCCDHAFEAAQRALEGGDLDRFKELAAQHQGLADLFNHLRSGGMIH